MSQNCALLMSYGEMIIHIMFQSYKYLRNTLKLVSEKERYGKISKACNEKKLNILQTVTESYPTHATRVTMTLRVFQLSVV